MTISEFHDRVSISGREGAAHQRALGRSRGRFTSELHCLAHCLGRPVAFRLTFGEAAGRKSYDGVVDLFKKTPNAPLGDKGYDADAIRAYQTPWVKIEHDRR